MSVPDLDRLLDVLQRDKLTPAQEVVLQRYLASHPDQRAALEDEVSLNHLLRQIPDTPISSNFTAQVLSMARTQTRAQSGWAFPDWRRNAARYWLPRLATAAVVLCFGVFSIQHHQQAIARQQLARNLANEISKVNVGPGLELLRNFDAIERLAQVPSEVDRRLIAALQ